MHILPRSKHIHFFSRQGTHAIVVFTVIFSVVS